VSLFYYIDLLSLFFSISDEICWRSMPGKVRRQIVFPMFQHKIPQRLGGG
jgi:hypothetical protein